MQASPNTGPSGDTPGRPRYFENFMVFKTSRSIDIPDIRGMPQHLVENTRVFINDLNLASQQSGLKALGVPDDLVYVDYGLTGRNRETPGLDQAPEARFPGPGGALTLGGNA